MAQRIGLWRGRGEGGEHCPVGWVLELERSFFLGGGLAKYVLIKLLLLAISFPYST